MRMPITQRIRPSSEFHGFACLSVLLLLTLSLPARAFGTQSEREVPKLELGRLVERTLDGGQTHSYRIALASGQYVHLVVEQRGVDVVVVLFGPDGRKVTEVDSPNGTQGPEPVFAIAETSGTYRVEVRSLEEDAPAGQYAVTLEELRQATRQDASRVTAEHLFSEAELLRDQKSSESLQGALQKYDEALQLFHAIGNRRREAATLDSIGSAHASLGDKKRALDYFARALPLRRAARDRTGEATTLNNTGLAYSARGDKQKALGYLRQALLLFRSAGDRGGAGTTLNNLGLIYTSLGQTQKALYHYQQALPLLKSVGDRYDTAITFDNLGYVYNSLGEKQKALDYYSQALPLFKSVKDQRGEGMALNGFGAVYDSLGEKQQALDYYTRARPLLEEFGEPGEVVSVLNNIALLYDSLGERQQALDYYERARPILHKLGDPEAEAAMLNNIGMLYDGMGDKPNADRYYNQALSLSYFVNNPVLKATTLNNLGHLYDSFGERHSALNFYKDALPLFRAVGNRSGEGTTLNNIGILYGAMNERAKALDFLLQSAALFHKIGDRYKEAMTLNNIGLNYYEAGDRQKALDNYSRSLRMRREGEDRAGAAATLYNLASLERDGGDLEASLGHIEAALRIVEMLRGNIVRQELRSVYFASVQDYYTFHVDLLMRLHKQRPSGGFDAAALQASERARARSLLEMLNESHAGIRQGIDPDLLRQEQSLQQQLDAKAASRARLLNGPHTAMQEMRTARELERLTTSYQEVEARIRQSSKRYAGLMQPTTLSLEEIQKELDPDTLLLEYSLGIERSYLWLVSPTEIRSFELPSPVRVQRGVHSFYESLNTTRDIYADAEQAATPAQASPDRRQQNPEDTSAGLSRMLLGPVAPLLGQKRLVIVADGALQYIPFAALPDPTTLDRGVGGMQPLIMEHEVLNLPSISTLATMRSELAGRKPAPKDLAVLADPVFYPDDERFGKDLSGRKTSKQNAPSVSTDDVTGQAEKAAERAAAQPSGAPFVRLKATRKEAQKVLALVPVGSSLSAFDFDASRALAVSEELSQYRYILFATHGVFDTANPNLSAVVFSLVDKNGDPQDGYLRAHDVYNLDMPAEVVMLSGCQTGLGTQIRGEGMVGLTRGFMYAGAARVVASLWNVDDEATAELVARFYRGILKEGKRPAEALRAAQIEVLSQKQWHAPHYWAAFVLQGEWR
jgi:CHAT domain-containing protein/tetratricopeptide (TPR) repeat protein